MSTATRLRAGASAHLRAFVRRPLHVALLLALPPVVVEVYGLAMETFPALPFLSAPPGTLGRINGAVFAAAFLAGLVGLFQVISAVQADERLRVCGYRRAELFLSRLGIIAAVSLLAASAAFAVLWWSTDVAAPLVALGALALAALIYGLLGVLIGAALPRELEGSLVLVVVADVDDFLASGLANVDAAIADFTPLHYPHALFTDAVREGSVATGDVLGAGAYVLALFVLALTVYVATTGRGGVLS